MLHAYFASSIRDFLSQNSHEILGALAASHKFDLDQNQRDAWVFEIQCLQSELERIEDGKIFFEFLIPRMGKRADCILLINNVIYVVEFKVGSATFDRSAIDQVHDYALDLKNFHRASHSSAIIPVLIATKATSRPWIIQYAADHVARPICLGLGDLFDVIASSGQKDVGKQIECETWAGSGYMPSPTIVEAARSLYRSHDVNEIARSDAGAMNLALTNERISRIIDDAKSGQKKSICFITGVPGAGKTLVGLNIATQRTASHSDEHAVFLSGNGPLVDVLREALARDQVTREKVKKTDAKRKVNSFIQNIHHFRDEYLNDQNAPIEKVVVFDEAQRAWTREQASKFMQQKRGQKDFDQSEPEFLISVMDRHADWCVVVCLIGGGQEINTGEAGIDEWLSALKRQFPDWQVHASSLLEAAHYSVSAEAQLLLEDDAVQKHSDLHLSVSMRSFRAEHLNGFVAEVLNGNAANAAEAYSALDGKYPILLTRDLNEAREWLRNQSRGSERYGMIASSGAQRLRPEGLHVKSSVAPDHWFLNDSSDVRSSYYLEEVGTEFDVQGLELDWACVAWDADLRWGDEGWGSLSFRGTRWQNVNSGDRRKYLKNAYRVLLTRARQGMVIFVPKGDDRDETRRSEFYDGTFEFLKLCGAKVI